MAEKCPEISESPKHPYTPAKPTKSLGLEAIRRVFGKRLSMLPLILALSCEQPQIANTVVDDPTENLDDEINEAEEANENTPYHVALEHEKEARGIIADLLKDEGLSVFEETILSDAHDYPHHYFLAVAIKESHLKPEVGYLQLESSAIKDLNESLPFLEASMSKASEDPSMNMAYGLLYLSLLKNRYIEPDERFENMTPRDKFRLTHIMYNLGLGSTKKMWDETEARDVDELVEGLEAFVAERLDLETTRSNALDTGYQVHYQESEVVRFYLENQTDRRLAVRAFQGSRYPTLRKLMISARYSRITDKIAKALKEDVREYAFSMGFLEPPVEAPEPASEEYTVRKGDTLWALSEQHGVSSNYLQRKSGLTSSQLGIGDMLKVPSPSIYKEASKYFYEGKRWVRVSKKGFYSSIVLDPEYNSYLQSEVEIDEQAQIQEVIVDFNRRFNPELRHLNDDCSNIPKGAFIWIPNVQYFMDYYGGDLEETPTPVAAPKPAPVPDPEPGPEVEISGTELDKETPGQYVQLVDGEWVRDLDAMRKGAQHFPTLVWDDHPVWDKTHLSNRSLFGGRARLEVEFIILHSTISETSADTIKSPGKQKAHFVIERDGTIKYLTPVNKDHDPTDMVPAHAGSSRWNGYEGLNLYSIAIEVVALDKQEWSSAQFGSVKELVHWLGGYYDLEKSDVLMHKQIAKSMWGRGRKQDPYGKDVFKKLNLPDNTKLLDLDVASRQVHPNSSAIRESHPQGMWDGLEAAKALRAQ